MRMVVVLPGAVRTEEAEQVALEHLEVDVVDGDQAPGKRLVRPSVRTTTGGHGTSARHATLLTMSAATRSSAATLTGPPTMKAVSSHDEDHAVDERRLDEGDGLAPRALAGRERPEGVGDELLRQREHTDHVEALTVGGGRVGHVGPPGEAGQAVGQLGLGVPLDGLDEVEVVGALGPAAGTGWRGEAEEVGVAGVLVQLEEARLQRRLAAPLGRHLDVHRQARGGVGPEVDRVDRRVLGRRADADPVGVVAGDPAGRNRRDLVRLGGGDEAAPQVRRGEVDRDGQAELGRALQEHGAVRARIPRPRPLGRAVAVPLAARVEEVGPPPVRALVPDPDPGGVAGQGRQVGRAGQLRQAQAAVAFGVAVVRLAGGGLDPGHELVAAHGRSPGRERVDRGGQGHEADDDDEDRHPSPLASDRAQDPVHRGEPTGSVARFPGGVVKRRPELRQERATYSAPVSHFAARARRAYSSWGGGRGAGADLVDDRGVGQRGRVAQLPALGDVAQEPAHDLAAAGLGQVRR